MDNIEIKNLFNKLRRRDESVCLNGEFIHLNFGGIAIDQWIETDFFDIRFFENKFILCNSKSFHANSENLENIKKIRKVVDYNNTILKREK